MRGLVVVLLCGWTALHAQSLKILPPALDDLGQRVFFGSSFTSDGLAGGAEIFINDSAAPRRLTRIAGDGDQTVTEFTVSGDGSLLAYTQSNTPGAKLRIVKRTNGEEFSIANPSRSPGSPHFAGNDKILFDAFGLPSTHTASYGAPIYAANVDGTGLIFLHRGALAPGAQRVVSKGGAIVFTSADPFATHALPQPPANVYLMNLDGSDVRAVTHFTKPAERGAQAQISAGATISASGDLIAFDTFAGTAQDAPSQIWTVAADGSSLRAITQADEKCDWPSISADGAQIAFTCKGQVYTARSDGSSRRALTRFRLSSASSPVITADGSRVFFTLGPVGSSFHSLWGPTQLDSYSRGAVWSVRTDGTGLAAFYAPHVLEPRGVVDAVSFNFLFPPVGGLITAFGANFEGDTVSAATALPLPTSMNGLALLVNGRPAPILAATPWQINAQLHPDLADGPTKFEIRFPDGSVSNSIQQEVRAISPNVLTLPAANSGGCQDAVLHAGSGLLADPEHPASAGEIVEIYASGLGPTRPQIPVGMAAPLSPPATLRYSVRVLMGGIPAPVSFAGLSPGLIGVYQINATVPAGLNGPREQIAISVNGGTLFGRACYFSVQ